MTAAILAVHAADLLLTLAVVSLYGLAAEANPAMHAALGLGPLGALAAKAALLAVVFSAASLGPRYRSLLLWGAFVGGCVGAASGVMAWAA